MKNSHEYIHFNIAENTINQLNKYVVNELKRHFRGGVVPLDEIIKNTGVTETNSDLHISFLETLNTTHNKPEQQSDLNAIEKGIIQISENAFTTHPKETILLQTPLNFTKQIGEKRIVSVCKFFKTLVFKSQQKITRKKVVAWKHKFELKKVFEGHILPLYIKEIEYIIEDYNRLYLKYLTELLEKTTKIDKDNALLNNEYLYNIIDGYENILNRFYTKKSIFIAGIYNIAGTIEYPNRLIILKGKRNLNNAFKSFHDNNNKWLHTGFAFYDDWRFTLHILIFKYHLKESIKQSILVYNKKIENDLLPTNKQNKHYIEQLLSTISVLDEDNSANIKSLLQTELYKLNKQISTENNTDKLTQAAKSIPAIFNKTEIDYTSKLEQLPNKVAVVKKPDYQKGIEYSDIRFFSPGEFIDFEIKPSFIKRNKDISNQISKTIESIVLELTGFKQIIDYSLDLAISLSENENIPKEKITEGLKEGLNRALKLNKNIAELIDSLSADSLTLVTQSFNLFIAEIEQLDDNDNIFNINSRILRAKAIKSSKEKRNYVFSVLKKTYNFVSLQFGGFANFIIKNFSLLQQKLNLNASSTEVTSDLSNFLINAQRSIVKLPVIYQHLFENAPIKEFNLFLHRNKELDKINKAYEDWLNDNYAATLIIGENGSGKSSLLLYYKNTTTSNYQISYFQAHDFYHTQDDFYSLISSIFGEPKLKTNEDIKQYIAQISTKRIIIIDGIERLFLRKTKGFECLQKLLTLIVSSNHKIFWICSVSLHAGNYLNKTISLNDFFDFKIEFENLSLEDIQNIILKRNKLSGFQIHFQESEIKNNGKKPLESQADLQTQYFSELNKFTKSNISLSLGYWLNSVMKIETDTVQIRGFNIPEFNFLESLSSEKLYTLLHIIIHGKISKEIHSVIFKQDIERSYSILTIMKEDAILIKKGQYFYLNGILFRHVVKLLTNKNLTQ